MIEKLKQLNATNLDKLLQLEEAMALFVYADNLLAGYILLDIQEPEWLIQSINLLKEEIARRDQAATMAEIRQTEAALEGLKTQSERKSDLQRKLAGLQKKVSGAATVGGRK